MRKLTGRQLLTGWDFVLSSLELLSCLTVSLIWGCQALNQSINQSISLSVSQACWIMTHYSVLG